nr:hypothetical protein 1634Bnrm3_p066 [Cryptomonas sp.]
MYNVKCIPNFSNKTYNWLTLYICSGKYKYKKFILKLYVLLSFFLRKDFLSFLKISSFYKTSRAFQLLSQERHLKLSYSFIFYFFLQKIWISIFYLNIKEEKIALEKINCYSISFLLENKKYDFESIETSIIESFLKKTYRMKNLMQKYFFASSNFFVSSSNFLLIYISLHSKFHLYFKYWFVKELYRKIKKNCQKNLNLNIHFLEPLQRVLIFLISKNYVCNFTNQDCKFEHLLNINKLYKNHILTAIRQVTVLYSNIKYFKNKDLVIFFEFNFFHVLLFLLHDRTFEAIIYVLQVNIKEYFQYFFKIICFLYIFIRKCERKIIYITNKSIILKNDIQINRKKIKNIYHSKVDNKVCVWIFFVYSFGFYIFEKKYSFFKNFKEYIENFLKSFYFYFSKIFQNTIEYVGKKNIIIPHFLEKLSLTKFAIQSQLKFVIILEILEFRKILKMQLNNIFLLKIFLGNIVKKKLNDIGKILEWIEIINSRYNKVRQRNLIIFLFCKDLLLNKFRLSKTYIFTISIFNLDIYKLDRYINTKGYFFRKEFFLINYELDLVCDLEIYMIKITKKEEKFINKNILQFNKKNFCLIKFFLEKIFFITNISNKSMVRNSEKFIKIVEFSFFLSHIFSSLSNRLKKYNLDKILTTKLKEKKCLSQVTRNNYSIIGEIMVKTWN